jgi:hypothetical protein
MTSFDWRFLQLGLCFSFDISPYVILHPSFVICPDNKASKSILMQKHANNDSKTMKNLQQQLVAYCNVASFNGPAQ